jgi:hypothetical protein
MDESVQHDEGTPSDSQEPKYNDIQMNDVVKRERERAYKQARRELEAEMARQAQPQPQAPQGIGGMPQNFDQGQFMEQISDVMMQRIQKQVEEQEKREREAHAQKEYELFLSKMKDGKERYSDFDETVKDFDVNSWPDVAAMAHEFENTSDIIYDLSKNPRKLADLDSYLRRGDRRLAKQQMKLLSDSIADNVKAKEEQVTAREPLNRLKSSPGAGAHSGQMGLKDFKSASWLRV